MVFSDIENTNQHDWEQFEITDGEVYIAQCEGTLTGGSGIVLMTPYHHSDPHSRPDTRILTESCTYKSTCLDVTSDIGFSMLVYLRAGKIYFLKLLSLRWLDIERYSRSDCYDILWNKLPGFELRWLDATPVDGYAERGANIGGPEKLHIQYVHWSTWSRAFWDWQWCNHNSSYKLGRVMHQAFCRSSVTTDKICKSEAIIERRKLYNYPASIKLHEGIDPKLLVRFYLERNREICRLQRNEAEYASMDLELIRRYFSAKRFSTLGRAPDNFDTMAIDEHRTRRENQLDGYLKNYLPHRYRQNGEV